MKKKKIFEEEMLIEVHEKKHLEYLKSEFRSYAEKLEEMTKRMEMGGTDSIHKGGQNEKV